MEGVPWKCIQIVSNMFLIGIHETDSLIFYLLLAFLDEKFDFCKYTCLGEICGALHFRVIFFRSLRNERNFLYPKFLPFLVNKTLAHNFCIFWWPLCLVAEANLHVTKYDAYRGDEYLPCHYAKMVKETLKFSVVPV